MPVCSYPEQEKTDPLLDLLADTWELGTDLKTNSQLFSTQETQPLENACVTWWPSYS